MSSKKWPNSGYTLKAELTVYTDGLEWDVKRMELRMVRDLA